MAYPTGSGAAAIGTDLGQIVLNQTDPDGIFSLVSNQKVLMDARQSYINQHNSHTGHAFTAENSSGAVTSYPTVVPFNSGWLSMQEVYIAEPDDPDWTADAYAYWNLVAIDEDGEVLWSTTADPADLNIPVRTGTDPVFGTQYMQAILIAGNNNDRVLMKVMEAASDEFYWLDFDNVGGFTRTFAFSTAQYAMSSSYEQRDQMLCGSGMIVFSSLDLYAGQRIYGLDADLDIVGYLTIPAGSAALRRVVPSWQGDARPHMLMSEAGVLVGDTTTDWTATPIVFDGVTAPSWGTPKTGTVAYNLTWNATTPVANGWHTINDWDVGDVDPKPVNYWRDPDGPTIISPNMENLETVYTEEYLRGSVGDYSFDPTIVTDWYGHHPVSSYYDGMDRWGSSNFVLRMNVANIAEGKAGAIDLVIQYPDAPTQPFTGFNGYWDSDLDDPAIMVPNGYNDRILAWTYNYWRKESLALSGGGYGAGLNRLSTYFVFQAGGTAPPPPPPAWVDVFGSTGTGTTPGGNGPCVDCGELGVGNHRAFLYDRGGTRKIAEITGITLCRWSRVRDDISTSTIIVNSPTPQCCAILAAIAVGRHEIVIFRDQDRVWEGPITRVNWKATSVEITSSDICHYLSRTIMHRAYDNRWKKTGSKVGPVTKRMQAIIAQELKRKESQAVPVNILRFLDVRTHPKTTRTSRFTHPYAATVWEEMDYMAQRLSLDYTTIGRRLVITDTHDALSRIQMLTDKDFTDELIVSSYGMELATISAVTDGEGHWASVGKIDSFYGEVELLHTTYGEGLQPETPNKPTKEELKALAQEMTSQAQRNLSGRYPIPTVVRVPDGTPLHPSAPVCINELVPGIRVPIRATLACLSLEQEQKLDKVTVEQTPLGETVAVTLSPAPGTTPWDDASTSSPGDEVED